MIGYYFNTSILATVKKSSFHELQDRIMDFELYLYGEQKFFYLFALDLQADIITILPITLKNDYPIQSYFKRKKIWSNYNKY